MMKFFFQNAPHGYFCIAILLTRKTTAATPNELSTNRFPEPCCILDAAGQLARETDLI